MREFTRSVLRLPLAMSVCGVEHMAKVFKPQSPKQAVEQATEALNAVSGAAEEQLTGTFKEVFKAGEELQKTVVETMFGVLKCDSCNDRWQWVTRTIRRTVARR